MKDIEIRLISELMKNSRRSDRQLGKALGVSQPTVSRTIKRLEKEGVIREYTVIPDFNKLGFDIMSISFAKLKEPVSEQKLVEVRKQVHEVLQTVPKTIVLAQSGDGLGAERVVIAFHKSYSAYSRFAHRLKLHPLVAVEEIKSFLIDLNYRNEYLPLTFSELAHSLTSTEFQENQGRARKNIRDKERTP